MFHKHQSSFKLNSLWYENNHWHMSRVTRKPFFFCENKDADQLRIYHEAEQRLHFRYTYSAIPLLA